jgi:hypothetical protein
LFHYYPDLYKVKELLVLNVGSISYLSDQDIIDLFSYNKTKPENEIHILLEFLFDNDFDTNEIIKNCKVQQMKRICNKTDNSGILKSISYELIKRLEC